MSYLDNALKGKKVLVTGATGFVGGRLAQRLAVEEAAVVTGTGRDLSKVPFLVEAGVTLQQADLLDEARMRQLLAGQEIVFHVAAWLGKGSYEEAHTINVTATAQLMRLAAEAGVQRFVHISSIAVYSPAYREEMDETRPIDLQQQDVYGRTKAEGEAVARKVAADEGLDLTIVRPAMVYGPRSMSWTLSLLQTVQKGMPVIFGDGSGHAYPVFIDNLVDGILLTAVRPEAVNEAFNFSDPPVDWHTFFGYYGRMTGRKLRRLPMWAAKLFALAADLFRLKIPLSRTRLKIYVQKTIFPITKAEKLLGYQPRVTLDEGMQKAEAWLREAGYLE